MTNNRVILGTVLLVLVFGTPLSQFAQNASNATRNADQETDNHALLLGFLRTIGAAEGADFSKYGSYESWQTLLAHDPEYLNGWLARYYSQVPNIHFGNMPEILPGWHLRLNAHADGQGYDVLLEDITDKNGYAALCDERGVIREGKWLP